MRRAALRTDRGSRLLPKAILVLSSAVIALAAAEGLARLLGIGAQFAGVASLAGVSTRSVDGVVLWNHAELRYDPGDIERAAADRDAFKILGLGDSIMYGIGQPREQTYLEQTRRVLARRSARPVEILNLAVPGYNTRQENAVYEEIHERIAPDLVIVHYWGDDVLQYGVVAGRVVDVGDISSDGVIVRALPFPGPVNDYLLVHSRLYGALTQAVAARHGPAPARDWTRVSAPLAAIQERAQRSHARLLVLASAELDGPTARPTADLAELRQFAAARGIEVIDLSEWLRGVDARQIAMDGCHFNAEGHRLIGEHLADYLLEHDLR